MDKTTPNLAKTCSSCGLLKPLSAYLQIAGPEGTTYGNICADCRKAQLDQPPIPNEPEDSSKSSTGFKVDAKAKVAGEKDKRKLRTDSEEQYYEEREEKDITQTKDFEKGEIKKQGESKHRGFLTQKRTFLGDTKNTEQQRVERARKEETAQHIQHAEKQIETAKQEQKEKDINMESTLDTGIAGKIKYTEGQAFKEFARWSGSALGRTFEQKKTEAEQKETPSEFIEKNWGPNSRGKR